MLPAPPADTAPSLGPPARERGFWERLFGPLFGGIRAHPESLSRLVDAHRRGLVVHTLRTRRRVDPLFILHLLGRLDLPRPRWLHDHFASKCDDSAGQLAEELTAGRGALLFLRRPRTLRNPTTAYSQAHVEALVALQRQLDVPILLLPETILWRRSAQGLRRTFFDALFGDRDGPGALREVFGFFWHRGNSRLYVGTPVDLKTVLENEDGQTDRIIAKKVRWAILNHLTREEEIRTGPMQRSAARTRQMVLKDGAVRRHIEKKGHNNAGRRKLESKADAMLKAMAADMRYGWLRVLDAVIDVLWSRIYDGIVVDEKGIEQVRNAARRGPVVLVPSHRSHVDYIVLSQVFFQNELIPPHIAAGDNLNFWPMGLIFRRSGAFFIRRSFRGDKLYSIVIAAYVRRLLKEGHVVEFFIEGGRSRTGKLLQPRMGMLTMCVDPVLEGALPDISFIPISISYEKVVEAGAFAKELQGQKKRKEDVTALLSSTKVLWSRYGRVYVDFSSPVSLRAFAAARNIAPEDARIETEGGLSEQEPGGTTTGTRATSIRRALVTQLGHRIVYGINQCTRVTPTSVTALILLAQTRRGIAQTDLYTRADRVVSFLQDTGARLSGSLAPSTRQAALREALGRFAAEGQALMKPSPDGETIYQITDAGRRALDYYKNNILHFFAASAIVALAVRVAGETEVPEDRVLEKARRISRILKHEFSFRSDRTFEDNFRQAADLLLQRQTLTRQTDDSGTHRWSFTPQGVPEGRELEGLLGAFFEGYRLAAELVDELPEGGATRKRFEELFLQRANRQVLEGRVLRAELAAQPMAISSLSVLVDEGVVQTRQKVEVADADRRSALIAELDAYL